MTHLTLTNIRLYADVGNIITLTLLTDTGATLETYMGKIATFSRGYTILSPYDFFEKDGDTSIIIRCSWLTRVRYVRKWRYISSEVPFRVPIRESVVYNYELCSVVKRPSFQGEVRIYFDEVSIDIPRERLLISRSLSLQKEAAFIESIILDPASD